MTKGLPVPVQLFTDFDPVFAPVILPMRLQVGFRDYI
jgi:hypothetical protein